MGTTSEVEAGASIFGLQVDWNGESQGVTEPIWPPPMLTERHHDHGHLVHLASYTLDATSCNTVGYGCRCHFGFAKP